MVRLKVVMAVTGAVILLFPFLTFNLTWGLQPWDEPVVCPKCKSSHVIYILYGEPNLDADLKRALNSGKVELGGCLVTRDSKRWECRACGHQWGSVGH